MRKIYSNCYFKIQHLYVDTEIKIKAPAFILTQQFYIDAQGHINFTNINI